MTVQGIFSPGKHAMRRACQGEKKTAQRRKGLPVRVLRIERRSNQPQIRKGRYFAYGEQSFMRVEEVAQELGVSKSYAYKIVQKLNQELKEKGYLTISGRVNRKYFQEKACYGGLKRKDS